MNRLFLCIFFFFAINNCFAQLKDDFTDGDFTNNPAWSGDMMQFKVNSSKQMQLAGTGSNCSYFSTGFLLSSLDKMEWHFWIHLGFSPSASNFGRVYLVADRSDLKDTSLNGYYLQFGEALSNDAIELFRQTGATSTSVCRGAKGQIANSFSLGVRIRRDSAAQWTLSVDTSGGTNYIDESAGIDASINTSNTFGVVCTYTSSDASSFYFDNFMQGEIENSPIQPASINPSDIVINEILAHVKTGGKEFVEIYNRSDKSIDLSQLQLCKRDLSTGILNIPIPITTNSLIIHPGDYLVLTDDPSLVKSQYQTLNPE